MSGRVLETDHGAVLAGDTVAVAHGEKLTDPRWWSGLAAGEPLGGGRGGVTVIEAGGQQWVWRHYRRGGMAARWSRDRYLYTGAGRTRSFREWRLLNTVATLGLPVPAAVAARYVRHGLFYTADLLTVRIPAARTLAGQLLGESAGPVDWHGVGAIIGRFHAAGVYHADLNATNILIDAVGRTYLLDFDRGRLRRPGPWRRNNLARLRRSLDKIGAAAGTEVCPPPAWAELLAGYDAA